MSKDKPEVGDVWINRSSFRVHIIGIDEDGIIYSCFYSKNELWQGSFIKKEFLEQHEYLGKSKANINDLFEVQDDKD